MSLLMRALAEATEEQPWLRETMRGYEGEADDDSWDRCGRCREWHRDFAAEPTWFGHKLDCPWIAAMRTLGRDLGPHRVYDPRVDCLRCHIYGHTLEEHHAHDAHSEAVRYKGRDLGHPNWGLYALDMGVEPLTPRARRKPIWASLPTFMAPRGNIRFIKSIDLSSLREDGQ